MKTKNGNWCWVGDFLAYNVSSVEIIFQIICFILVDIWLTFVPQIVWAQHTYIGAYQVHRCLTDFVFSRYLSQSYLWIKHRLFHRAVIRHGIRVSSLFQSLYKPEGAEKLLILH